MNKRFILSVVLSLILVGLFVWWGQSGISTQGEICEYTQTGYKDCSKHHIVVVALWKIAEFSNWISPAVTALATGVIAWLTRRLWQISRREWKHNQQVERAFVSGGGSPELRPADDETIRQWRDAGAEIPPGATVAVPTGRFRLDINNHGKTRGTIVEYGYGFCEADEVAHLPERPEYRWVYFRDQIGPGTQSRPIKHVQIPDGEAVIFGRYGYLDIFGRRHSDGFIQNGGTPIQPPFPSYTQSDPDWDLPHVGRRDYEEEEPQ
jgi:hypothetical protein